MARVGSNGSLGMGIAFVLEDYFSDTARDIRGAMGDLDEHTERLARNAQNSFALIATGAGMVAASIAGLSFFKKASDIRAEFQAYEVQFETLLQSADRANAFMEKIKQDAKDNPIFGTESLVRANAALVATGNVAEDQSRRISNNLAEILAGAGKGDAELIGMSANLQQIANLGKASSQDIKQFGMAGIPIYKLIADSMGITIAQAQEMDVSLEQLDKAFAHATSSAGMFYGATERARMSTKGLKAALQDNVELTMERIGKAIEPITRKLYIQFGALTDKIYAFVNSEFGAKVTRWVVAGFALLGVMGMLLVMYGASRLAIFKLAGVFGQATKATILQAIATKGLTGGLRQMAIAAWASLGPYVIIIGVLALVAFAMYKAWKMITEGSEAMAALGVIIGLALGPIGYLVVGLAGIKRGFSELEKPIDEMATSGVLGFFTRLAATIDIIRQVWSTWDGENAMITEDMMNRLDKLWIREWGEKVISVVTRLKQAWNGFKKALEPVTDMFKKFGASSVDTLSHSFAVFREKVGSAIDKIGKALGPLMPYLEKIFTYFFGDLKNLDKWEKFGYIIGKLVVFAIQWFLRELERIVTVIAWVIEGVGWFYEAMADTFARTVQEVQLKIAFLKFLFFEIPKALWEIGKKAFQAGVDWVVNLKNGFVNTWSTLIDAVSTRLEALVNKIKNGMKTAYSWVTTGGGLWGEPDEGQPDNTSPTPKTGGGGNFSSPMPSSKIPFSNVTNNTTNNNGGKAQPIIVQTLLDGNLILESLTTRQNLNNTRND